MDLREESLSASHLIIRVDADDVPVLAQSQLTGLIRSSSECGQEARFHAQLRNLVLQHSHQGHSIPICDQYTMQTGDPERDSDYSDGPVTL